MTPERPYVDHVNHAPLAATVVNRYGDHVPRGASRGDYPLRARCEGGEIIRCADSTATWTPTI